MHLGHRHLIAAGRRRFAGRRGAGNGVDRAGQLQLRVGAEIMLGRSALGLDLDATVRLAIRLVLVGDRVLGPRRRPGQAQPQGRHQEGGRRSGGLDAERHCLLE